MGDVKGVRDVRKGSSSGPPGPKATGPAEQRTDDIGVERYEALRAQALAGDVGGGPLGLAVFEHRGMAAWPRVGKDITPTTPLR